MKPIVVLILIHIFAVSMVRAEDAQLIADPSAVTEAVSDCKDLLPQVESDYKELQQKYKNLNQSSLSAQDGYFTSFNQMTQVLFDVTAEREEETRKISQSRDQLRTALQNYNIDKSAESSKVLQDRYLDLTVRLYSTLMDSQKILESLKGQMSQVEATRGQFTSTRQELEALDHQKLAMEAKLISLKIKCSPDKRY